MPEIRELSKSMINKIAAGEVVERPANVVKELVENSVDAGAKRIEIVVEKSGSDLIKIVDNGCGIAAEQLVLALSPHSTSKVSEADDLSVFTRSVSGGKRSRRSLKLANSF
jgi:DNA mismatch repair protein MutL